MIRPKHKIFLFLVTATLLWLSLSFSAGAVEPLSGQADLTPAQPENPIRGVAVVLFPEGGLPIGRSAGLVLAIGVEKGFHLNSDKPPLDWLKPTTLTFEDHPFLKVTKVEWPAPKRIKFAFADEPLPVFDQMVMIRLEVTVSPEARPGQTPLKGRLDFQACTEAACLPPDHHDFTLDLTIAAAGSTAAEPLPAGSPSARPESFGGTGFGPKAGQPLPLVLLITFLGGLALNLTPCVYPLLPITLAYFGGQGRTRRALALHGLVFLAGLIVVYTFLGTTAALSGRLLGSVLQHPLVLVGVAGLLAALAGSMFGFYEFRLPGPLARLGGAGAGRRGYLGSLIMGLTLGLVAAPCIGPFILGVLTFVARSADPVLGSAVFFSLSLGLGLPLAVLGLFSSRLVAALPASGPWLVWVRRLLGAVMVIMAVYLLRPLFSESVWRQLMAASAVAGALTAYFSGREVRRVLRLGAVAAFVAAAAFHSLAAVPPEEAHWPLYTPARFSQAQGRPIVLDFYADWCAPCRELARNLADPKVTELTGRLAVFKVDLTDWRSAEAEALRVKHRIRGVPTLVFLGPDGQEMEDLRLIGVAGPRELARLFGEFLRRTGG